MTRRREPPNHETLTCYTDYACRLPACRDRYNTWNRDRGQAISAGTWQPLVDAEPIRQHLIALDEAGITFHRVSVLTGLPYKSVRAFVHHDYGHAAPRRRRATPEVAAKILAIGFTDSGYVSPIGSERRFQALVAMGWPTLHTARRAGLHPSNRNTIFRAPSMRAATAQRIAVTYDEMRTQNPARHGVSAVSIKRAKAQAAERRWPDIAYWADRMDVIDDPDFEPLYGVTNRELVAQDANWVMRTSGLDRANAAARLGVSKSYIDHAFRDHPEYAVDTAA
ncbi:hypothetical protein [Streptomyces sp. NPDC013489]|uniref:hypothetical protein n=1 Tax=Streptomyces sp. NPDC013489 TaxID=3155606 RepID=UPI0033E218CD